LFPMLFFRCVVRSPLGYFPSGNSCGGIIDTYSLSPPVGSTGSGATAHGSRSKARESPVSSGPIPPYQRRRRPSVGLTAPLVGARGNRQRSAAVLIGQLPGGDGWTRSVPRGEARQRHVRGTTTSAEGPPPFRWKASDTRRTVRGRAPPLLALVADLGLGDRGSHKLEAFGAVELSRERKAQAVACEHTSGNGAPPSPASATTRPIPPRC
jgi:hypothetical protein